MSANNKSIGIGPLKLVGYIPVIWFLFWDKL